MRKALFALVAIVLGTGAQAAPADFTDYGWYTHDTISGLYWLDITATQSMRVDEVVPQLQPGGRLEGWRYATADEFETMIANIGFGRQGNPCQYTGGRNCDIWTDNDYRVLTRKTLDLFGNTWDPYAEFSYDWYVPDANTPRAMYGTFADRDAYIADPDPWRIGGFLHERITSRSLFTRGGGSKTIDEHHYIYGAWLVRSTVPAALTPLPDTTPAGAIDFDNVSAADLGLTFICDGAGGGAGQKAACSGHMMIPLGPTDQATADMWLSLPAGFDRQATPYLRIAGFDFREFQLYDHEIPCNPGGATWNAGVFIEDAEGKHYVDVSNSAPAPQGGGWCRVTLDTEYQFLPPLAPDDQVAGVAPVIRIGGEGFNANYSRGIGLDNIVVEQIAQNISIDFDPWEDGNEIRPNDTYWVGLMIKTTSTAMGDPYDFDASTVDVNSLRFGPAGATNVATTILTADYDADGDTDYIYAFRIHESGLTCIDHTVTVAGKDLSGNPIAGSDVIVPINCEATTLLDVDPWNAANIVRPNESYTVPVAILSTQVANGESADIDATQVDPASLKFGPNQAPHTGSTITTDLDGDSDVDVVFGFNAFDSGLACGDTELTMEGNLYSTLPIVGADSVTTADCETGGCHP